MGMKSQTNLIKYIPQLPIWVFFWNVFVFSPRNAHFL